LAALAADDDADSMADVARVGRRLAAGEMGHTGRTCMAATEGQRGCFRIEQPNPWQPNEGDRILAAVRGQPNQGNRSPETRRQGLTH
jgi:hypothetical protein